jgi:hypothetical protein
MIYELPLVREAYGFRRTACGCPLCQAPCRHLPGALDPADLPRLCPPGHELLPWAEQHLRAMVDKPYPTLVPARRESGYCHWYVGGACAVHPAAPFGCAFFDAHMPAAEEAARVAATVQAIRDDEAANGCYFRVWLHLKDNGLIGRSPDRAALMSDLHRIRRRWPGVSKGP